MALGTVQPRGDARAFTIIELIVSIAIIALLLGIAVFGVRTLQKSARGTVAQTMVNQIAAGIDRFEDSVGFLPPLVKDRGDPVPAVTTLTLVRGARNAVRVYEPDVPADVQTLNDLVLTGNVNNNPFEGEFRYSDASLAFFLVGALDYRYTDNGQPEVVIDGVKGPGMYKPTRDGEFGVPRELVNSNGDRRVGTPLESFVNIGSGGAKLAYATANEPRSVRLVDAGGVPIRYYRWINGNPPANNANGPLQVQSLDDLKVPRMVGRFTVDVANPVLNQTTFPTPLDRDIRQNTALKSATWAVVAAGPNGVFGDEPLQDIAKALGRSYDVSEEPKLRAEAEQDNIVKVGDGQ